MRRSSALAQMREREIVIFESEAEERMERESLLKLIFEILDRVRTTENTEKEVNEKC